MEMTTIQISKETREKLNGLRFYRRATYDEIIEALVGLVPKGDSEGEYTAEFRASLLRSLTDMRSGRSYSSDQVKKKLGA